MQTEKQLQTLISKNSKGAAKYWQIRILSNEDGEAFTQTEAWQDTASGQSKHIVSVPSKVEAKNVGRANETTPLLQAISEAESKWTKKCDKGYWVLGEPEPVRRPGPMRAQNIKDNEDNVVYPCVVQHKEDGSRMCYDGEVGWTRGNKEVLPEAIAHLAFDTEGFIVDGELTQAPSFIDLPYLERSAARIALFQKTQSYSKKVCPENKLLRYLVYDIVDESRTLTYAQRREILENLDLPDGVVLIEERLCEGREAVDEFYQECLAMGYEGAMVRNLDGVYRINEFASKDLLKVKPLEDEEFPIIAVEAGKGKDAERPVFIVDLGGGLTASGRLMGSQEYAAEVWARRDSLVGAMVTIEHEGRTPDGSLRFPKAKALREVA